MYKILYMTQPQPEKPIYWIGSSLDDLTVDLKVNDDAWIKSRKVRQILEFYKLKDLSLRAIPVEASEYSN